MAALRIQIADGGAGGAARQIATAPDSVVAVHAGDRIEVSGAVIVGAWITGDDVTLRFDDGTARSFENLAHHLGRADGVSVVSNGGSRIIESLDDLKSLTAGGPELGTGGSLGPRPAVIPSDPGFANQWHLNNTAYPGIDLNVTGVWDEYTGSGVVVGVVDEGIDYTHPDLAGNYRFDLDYDARDFDFDSFASAVDDVHGTLVSGVIAASLDGSGVVGVAPGADLTMFRVGFGPDGTEAQFLTQMQNMANVDVANNSWGFPEFFADDFGLYPQFGAAIENAVSAGRGGLGTVITFAAGNYFELGDDVNYHNFQNSPHTIAVAAIERDGSIAYFSTPGAAILVSAPGVDIYTTDHTGSQGVPGDFDTVNGTSFSAPAVAGVAALMLEANSDLGYRDVQEILAYSAVQTTTGAGWQTNAAGNWNGGGLTVSHDFGFGLVDAHAAVRLAETWEAQSTLANRASLSATSVPGAAILDHQSTTDTIAFASGLEIDHVQVAVDISHTFIGDLTVVLTSPEGTTSTLVNRPGLLSADLPFGSNQQNIDFTLSSTQFWGETGAGAWTLTVSDAETIDQGTFNAWTLTLLGDALTADDVYVYTDAWAGVGADAARQTVADTGGTDTLNFAAVTAGFVLDLAPGAANTLYGNAIAIDAATVIENAIGGDGADSITGNDAANVLSGMRGADTLAGGAGDDLLVGGAGDDVLAGGAGSDTAVYSGLASAYAVAFDGTTGTVTGAEGTDTITGIEWLQFADGTQALVPANQPPVAVDDTATTDEDTPVTITAAALLANDSDPDGDALSLVSVGNAVNGSVALDGAGDVVFTPDADFNGAASFEYMVSDGNTASTASVAVTVNPVNDAPVAANPIPDQTVEESQPFSFQIPTDTFTDLDAGDTLSYSAAGLAAGMTFDASTGTFDWTPGSADVGSYSIQITATDSSGLSASDTFVLTISAIADEVITGDDGPNYLVGGAGDDSLFGLGGDDVLEGNAGNDTLDGGSGNDWLNGGSGANTYIFSAGWGNDVIDGFADTAAGDSNALMFNDVTYEELWTYRTGDHLGVLDSTGGDNLTVPDFYGTSGDGTWSASMPSEAGGTVVIGPTSDINGNGVADVAEATRLTFGTAQNDTIAASSGTHENVVWGGLGNDSLYGADNFSVLFGGGGGDQLYSESTLDGNYLIGGDGNDTYYVSSGDHALIFDNATSTADWVEIPSMGFTYDTTFALTIDNGRHLFAYQSNDGGNTALTSVIVIDWRSETGMIEQVVLGDGTYSFDYISSNLTTAPGYLGDFTWEELGLSTAEFDAEFNFVSLLAGDDQGPTLNLTIGGTDSADVLQGFAGDNVLLGGLGNDTLNGGSGDDTMSGGVGDDVLDGGDGNDTAVYGGNAADYVVTVNGGTATVSGIEGTDTLTNVEILQFADQTAPVVSTNQSPVAVADAASTDEDTPLTIAAATLLANDTDADGDTLTITAVGNAVNGGVALDGNGDVVFTPDANFNGAATFDYTVSDGNAGTDTATVTVTVNPINDGPIFTDSGQDLGTAESNSVVLADVDGDGDLDAFVANGAGNGLIDPNKVWLNDGDGVFTDSGQSLGTGESYGVDIGDVDGDGDLDAFVANNTTGQANPGNKVWLNDGNGVFTDSGQSLGMGPSFSVVLADVDGDGDLDAFVANSANQANKVWLNDGSGVFTDSGQSLGTADSTSVDLGDVDGDGDLDAFVANHGSQPNKVWLNDGNGVFTDSGQSLGSGWSYEVEFGDIDGDGDLDAFVANTGQANTVWLNDGNGVFTDSGQSLGTANSISVDLADVDGDGDLDAFVANDSTQPNKVWLNDGSGVFTDSGLFLGSASSWGVDLGDVDDDGDLDAFIANRYSGANKVWLNNTGTVASPVMGTPGDDTLNGTENGDVIYGLGGNDTLDGGAGDDILNGGAGDDILNGGDGADVAVYEASMSGYTITSSGSGVTVTDTVE